MLETISLKRKPGSRRENDQVIAACCQECTVGCGLLAYVKDERIVDIQGDERHPVSRGRLCARGIAFVQGLTSAERITLPGTRNRLSGPFEAFDNWEKGIDTLADRLRRVKEQHGAESLIIGCDPEAGLDFYLGALRFARLFGTPHVLHSSQAYAQAALPEEVRHPSLESAQWDHSRCLVLIEADLAATHPVAFRRVLEAQRNGAKIIAADSRFTATLSKADMALLIAPNRGNDLGVALMKMMLDEQLVDTETAQSRHEEFEKWRESYAALPMDGFKAAIGLGPEKIRALAHALGRCQPATLITAKRLSSVAHYGIWRTMARVMGWLQATGGGWYPLESGTPPLDSTIGLEEVAPAVSGSAVPASPPQSDRSHAQRFEELDAHALIGSGNCLADFLSPLGKRINDLDLAVYFGSFPNRTRQAAHMVFPAAVWAERDCVSFTNDGALQWSPRIVKPGDACRTGLGFWMRLAQRFGWDEHFPWIKANGLADQKAFFQWLFEKNPQIGGLQLDRITQADPQIWWRQDAVASLEADGPLLAAPEAIAAPRVSDDPSEYPLGYQTTRAATRSRDASRWWPWIRELEDEVGIRIHPLVAKALEIDNGAPILVASENEVIEGRAAVSRSVPPRLVWSLQRMQADHVIVYRKGQAPGEARERLKAIEL